MCMTLDEALADAFTNEGKPKDPPMSLPAVVTDTDSIGVSGLHASPEVDLVN